VLIVGTWMATSPDALTAQGKNKPPKSADASMTVVFRDAGNDGLVSDGAGTYVHGSAGVEALVYAASGDLRLDFTSSTRHMLARLGDPLVVFDGTAAPANVEYASQQTLFVEQIASVQVGNPERRRARIGLAPGLPNYALGFRYLTTGGAQIEGTELCVSRVTADTWTVASSSACSGEGDVAGLFQENLKGKVSHRRVATYFVPFEVSVTCTLNCPQ
jgi:hypothetical protein